MPDVVERFAHLVLVGRLRPAPTLIRVPDLKSMPRLSCLVASAIAPIEQDHAGEREEPPAGAR